MRYLFSPVAASIPADAKSVENIISQNGRKLVPDSIEARVGDTLTFLNDEKRKRHNIVARLQDSSIWISGNKSLEIEI